MKMVKMMIMNCHGRLVKVKETVSDAGLKKSLGFLEKKFLGF